MLKCVWLLLAAVSCWLVVTCSADGHGEETLTCPDSWFLGSDKCYRIFYGENKLAYDRAREVCKSYGSRLVTFKDQYENDLVGEKVEEMAGAGEAYYIGLSREADDNCVSCPDLKWSSGEMASEYEGFWSDSEPDDSDGGCVFARKNDEDYCYDRPYAWSFCNCLIKRSFVCERMAAPEDTFHCHSGGYINNIHKCNASINCEDGSDELDCSTGSNCRYYHRLPSGDNAALGQLFYRDAWTCTWAIETPVGTNAYVQLNNFNTEFQADYVTVYAGNVIETMATRIDRISGDLGTKVYRSHNNMMILKFTSDSSVSNTGRMTGFTGIYGALQASGQISLIAENIPRTYSLTTLDVANTNTFLGQNDYFILIETQNQYQLGPMITLEILSSQLNDEDMIILYDGATPADPQLSTYCNDDSECNNYPVVYSTGRTMSVLIRTGKTVTNNVGLTFRYRQGCHYETTEKWGTLFTPGFPSNINYPNMVTCTWTINVDEPVALYFDPTSRLQDASYNRDENGDYLKMYDNGTMFPSSQAQLTTSDIAGKVFLPTTGKIRLELETTSTRSAKGFLATWSPACENPNYDDGYTIISTPEPVWHYMSSMTVSCKSGYEFRQEQTQTSDLPTFMSQVTVECGFKGIWKNYLQIPKCLPKYCGPVPNIANGIIQSSPSVVFGGTATYKCNAGSVSNTGSLEITCQANGNWSPTPICIAATCTPGVIFTSITNGNGELIVGDGTSIGTVYQFTCNPGFEIDGEPFVFCQEDGSWTQNSSPTCQRLTCLLPEIENGFYSGSNSAGGFISFSSNPASVSCDNGFKFADNSPISVSCSADRTVSELPQCIDRDECENANICDGTCHNTVGSFYCSCDSGFTLAQDQSSCLDVHECNLDIDNCDGGCQNLIGSYSCSCSAPYVLYTEDMTSGFAIPTAAGERGDLSTDTYYIDHSCVLVNCSKPEVTINNGQILTKRDIHRYGDHVEYQCDRGYTPARTVITCDRNGNWVGAPPTCQAVTCTDTTGFLRNSPTYTPGPYALDERLTLQCDVAGRQFEKYRFCTYNNALGTYEMQGSPYECGVVDCGQPQQSPGSNYGTVSNTLFNATFEFTCGSNARLGTSGDGSISTVRCLAEGYWDFGSLRCTGQSCLDPGYPAGGSIIASSLGDKSTVTFDCDRSGYTLTSDVTLTCQGTSFVPGGLNIPTCIDTENPVISGCPTSPIVINKYELLQPRLPQLTVSDNTGIASSTIEPRNANSTLYVSANLVVTYRVTDHAGNSETCSVSVQLADETPPNIQCPSVRTVELQNDSDIEQYTKLTVADVVTFGNIASIKDFSVTGEPTSITVQDLFSTITYTVSVTDQSNNPASCRGQIFIRPRPCSDLDYSTPLNADKTCTDVQFGTRQCVLTCRDSYTFEDSKTKTIQCSNGVWNTPRIPACVLDVTLPVVICPSSRQINNLAARSDQHEVDFSLLANSVTSTDLNTLNEPQFSPEKYTFTPADLYRSKLIQVSVTDVAGNTGTCNFQYTAVPPICSDLSLPVPQFGSVQCSRRVGTTIRDGWDCTITCQTGKILRNHGFTKSVNCDDGFAWSDSDIFPACVDDTKAPVISCPASRVEYLYTGNDFRTIDFSDSTGSSYTHTETDFSGIQSVSFNPPSLQISTALLNSARPVTMTVRDNANNQASCSFQVLIRANDCSPLALEPPVNGDRSCSTTTNGYSCVITCNPGHSFVSTVASSITTTCSNGGTFTEYIPDCVDDSDTENKQYIATLQYEYVPDDRTVPSVDNACISNYIDKVTERSATNVFDSILDEMGGRLEGSCESTFGPFPSGFLNITFFPLSTTGRVISDGFNLRVVQMEYQYTVLFAPDPTMDTRCTDAFKSQIQSALNTFPLSQNIAGDGTCPPLQWNNVSRVIDENEYCILPYFRSLTDTEICSRCPAGTQSNGNTCNICSVGFYATVNGALCEQCPLGYTTPHPGAVSINKCIAPCGFGQVSGTGYSPCYLCPVGSYKINNQQCQTCGIGETTAGAGSATPDACVDSTSLYDEPCSVGTQDVGNRVCELCSVGTYRSANVQTCVSCPSPQTSTYFKGSTTSADCYGKCSNGFVSSTGMVPCTPCPVGRYFVNETTCLDCPTDFTTVTTGSTVCVRLTDLRLNCPKGTSRDINTGQCTLCAEGTFNAFEEANCVDCGNDGSTYNPGATSRSMCQAKCPPGFFSSTGLSPCFPCGVGNYSVVPGSNACMACSPNNDMTTATTTSTSASQCIAQCSAGQFSDSGYNLNGACRQCPRHHYQQQSGQTTCTQCTANSRFSTGTGLTDFSQCLDLASQCDGKCQNGNCALRNNEAVCDCPLGQYYGPNCAIAVNHCLSQPCYNNGACSSTPLGYTCNCVGTGATGLRCETVTPTCDTSQNTPTCANGGHCLNKPNGPECLCVDGFGGPRCTTRTNICAMDTCDPVGTRECRDVSLGSNLRRYCDCHPGYTGETCSEDIDECASDPCINGGACQNLLNSFRCDCLPGYSGTFCQTRADRCQLQFYNCRQYDSLASCVDVYSKDQPTCICNPGHAYDGNGFTQYQIAISTAPSNLDIWDYSMDITIADCRDRCTSQTTNCNRFAFDNLNRRCYLWSPGVQLNLIFNANVYMYTKSVIYPEDDFYSPRYNINPIDPFNPDAERLSTYRGTYGLDICGGTEPLSARCCRAGTTCLHNEGLPSGTQCTSEGLTTDDLSADYTIQFKCSVNRVFQRNDCRQKTDYCGLDTCKNGGICNSIFGGYVCNCQNGYTGRNCQTNIDDCAGNPCSNGGTCEDQVGFYTCKCTSAYEGPNCNSPKNFCSTQNCNGNGLCRNIEGVGFECTCNNGYEGVLCEDEVDKCGSNPCQHGGQCSKLFNDYVCGCVPGWTGKDCENAVQHCLISQSGGQCVGNCYNIFNSYYCECEANAFGTNCENKPNPCRDYDKCQNNAVCSYNTSMSCMCPTKYTGDGCEILRDFCGKENPCENDATCLVTDTGYQCQCKPGYNGMRCENEIDECNTATCPVNGQCYDAINKYYCRCPIRYTGTDCGKVFDRNYDLYFGLPKGCGFAWIPYFIPVETADYLSISLWVRYSNNDDTGVYLTQFIGDKLEDASTFLELNEQGVRVYVQNGNDPFIQLTYDRQAKVNDGNWHLVTVLCDMVNGEIKHYLDSIKHDSQVAPALVMPASTFRMWVVLGCEFDNVEQKCLEGGRGFNGYLSQVNFYKRELTFERSAITDIEGDIPKNFRLPQHIFDSNIEDLILVWNEYEFESCVNRMIPSEANGVACSDITRSPACSSYRTTALPYVTGCPEDMVVTTQDRVVTVTWDEPTFHKLGVQSRVVKPNRLPGSIFTWGVYRNTYIGIDGNNNKAFCHFTLHVTAGQCDTPPDPRGGSQTCNNVADRQGCMISCNNVNQNTYMIDREHPDLFTCGPSGWWNADKPFRRCRYPSCGLAMATPKQRIFIHVSYRVGTSAYTAAKRNAEVRTYEELIKLKEIFDGDFCQAADCSDVDVVVSRGSTNIALESVLLLDITLSSVSARTTLDGEEISAVEFLTYFILGGNILIFETIPDFEFQKEDFTIEGREICPMGQVVLNGLCVQCGPGNYFRYTDSTNTTAICDDCGFGTYQDQSGASTCKSCGSGETTEMTGEYQQSSCKKICPTGQYFNSIIQDCAECAEGYYQDEVGQFRCKGCPAGYTTKDMGAISSVECSVSCESGYELNNDGLCDPCPIGQYRNATQTRTCVPCGSGTITLNVASKSRDDCNIVECSAGSYRDVVTNLCKACPLNQYQPNKWQTRCISCGDASRWRTEDVGSDSQSKCLYFCPSGYEAKQDPTNQCNICPIGFYKNNNDDIQGPCRECPNNRRTENNGSTSAADCTIYKCPVGYKPNSLNTDCVVCPEGQYQDVEFSTDCKQCQNGYSTRQNASTSGSQCERFCPSGQEKIGELCLPCKLGSYKNNLDGLFKECEQCDEDFTTLTTGSDDELDCNIRTCPPGTKRNADDSGCEDCPLGSYQPIAYQKDCIPCTSGTSTRNTKSTSADQCETYCESGFEETVSGCVACTIGYTKNNVDDGYFAPCKMCPIDYITAGINSTSEAQCTVGNCSAGQYLKPDKTCGLCEKGTFQPDKWQSECIDCGLDKTTENVGSDEQSDCILECQPGFEDIGGVCSPCRRGYYKIETAAALCRQCRTGFTTETTGANSPALCVLPACEVGTYLDKETDPDNPLCVPCGYDTYQDEIWQEECKSCLNNRVTLQIGADESTDCVLDCASGLQYHVDEQKCVFCGIGYYRNRDDRQQPQCQLCPLDTITAGEGSIDRTQCEIANCTTWGYYRDVDTNTCKECPLGKYNSKPWQTSCTDCPLGNSTKSTGTAFITDCISVCPLGQFVGTNNNCQLCARGTYRSDVAADTCTDCPNRLITPGLGADSENDCSISPCAAGQQYALNSLQCTDCPVGTYQPNSGSFQCIECPFAIKFTPREGAVSADECRSPCGAGEQFDAGSAGCVPCPSGTYQPTTLQFSCLQCPEGRKYTSQTGTTRIEDCLSYCSVSDANDCSVNASCSISTTSAQGYTCSCFSNYDSIGASNGRVCLHKCDRGYCENDATCTREPTVRCTCSKWYRGDRCEIRIKAEDLSDDTLDIVIPVSIAAGGLILFLIILAVCCLCWRRAHPMQTPAQQYSEFNGDRIDKASLHSHTYGAPYGSRPPSRLMLAPGPEMHYDNQLYSGKDHAAVYEA